MRPRGVHDVRADRVVESMIELDRVTKRYGRRGAYPDALHEVTAHVPAGEVWAIVGPNGAGKSTLLSLVLGFVRASAGRIRIGGEAPRDFVRARGAGYLPERFRVPGVWTVGAALRLFARLDGSAADLDGTIRKLGLEPLLERRTGELSRGMLQRLGLAQALLAPHPLVVLDEPTEGLDPIWRMRLRDLLRQQRDAGSTVILASHDLGEVERVADRAIVLERGTVRTVLDTREAGDAAQYRIRLQQPVTELASVFPHADPVDGTSFTVAVGSAKELSERLGALIALGGIVTAVEPVRQALEERVRDTLAGDG
jgi:ABC-2 type transport system ATP-binding protein